MWEAACRGMPPMAGRLPSCLPSGPNLLYTWKTEADPSTTNPLPQPFPYTPTQPLPMYIPALLPVPFPYAQENGILDIYLKLPWGNFKGSTETAAAWAD